MEIQLNLDSGNIYKDTIHIGVFKNINNLETLTKYLLNTLGNTYNQTTTIIETTTKIHTYTSLNETPEIKIQYTIKFKRNNQNTELKKNINNLLTECTHYHPINEQ
ncbi:hypothetical protein GQ473_05785 [archaeon]|nr:hypothetical protein [archaeon]